MNSTEEIQNFNYNIIYDSSELSSDISEEQYEISTKTDKYSSIVEKENSFIEEFNPTNIIVKKRSRSLSQNLQINYNKRNYCTKLNLNELKIKKINRKLKNIVKKELIINSNKRKFTF